MVQILWKLVWGILKKLKPNLPYDWFIPLLGKYPKVSTFHSIESQLPLIPATLFVKARQWKQAKCPSPDKCKMKMWNFQLNVWIKKIQYYVRSPRSTKTNTTYSLSYAVTSYKSSSVNIQNRVANQEYIKELYVLGHEWGEQQAPSGKCNKWDGDAAGEEGETSV